MTQEIFVYCGTDPDKGILRSRSEILARISSLVSFSPKIIEDMLDTCLERLSTKPRRIRHHEKEDAYCLPFDTRVDLESKSLEDRAIFESFKETAQQRLRGVLSDSGIKVRDVWDILERVLNKLFYEQGLEFADFVIKGENRDAVDKSLPDVVSSAIADSQIVVKNRSGVTSALLQTIREIIYRGTDDENEYLRRLSNSYMMLFLLQCDPKVATYFSTLAAKCRIFVCTSILIPALSELPLDPRHRRHWNLLVRANQTGVKLMITKDILQELAAHIQQELTVFQRDYADREEIFMNKEAVRYITNDILIRSYFYSRMEGKSWTFKEFLESFCTLNYHYMQDELIEWLRVTFGIDYVDDASLGVEVDPGDIVKLSAELFKHKKSHKQAENDALTVMKVFALREKNNERGEGGIFGYKTWWLSKDTTTQRAVTACFGDRYTTTCYMRPDFLYNYISLAPSPNDTDSVFAKLFPTLMGVSISHHIPHDVADSVHRHLATHNEYPPARVAALLRSTTDQLMTGDGPSHIKQLVHKLDEGFARALLDESVELADE